MWAWWGREGMWLNCCDNILNGSEHGLHTTWTTSQLEPRGGSSTRHAINYSEANGRAGCTSRHIQGCSSIKSGSVGSWPNAVWRRLCGKLIKRSGHVLHSADYWHCTESSGFLRCRENVYIVCVKCFLEGDVGKRLWNHLALKSRVRRRLWRVVIDGLCMWRCMVMIAWWSSGYDAVELSASYSYSRVGSRSQPEPWGGCSTSGQKWIADLATGP